MQLYTRSYFTGLVPGLTFVGMVVTLLHNLSVIPRQNDDFVECALEMSQIKRFEDSNRSCQLYASARVWVSPTR